MDFKKNWIKFVKNKPSLARISFSLYNHLLREKKYRYFIHQNIVIHKYKAIYFPIPKVASSSMKKFISRILNIKGSKEHERKSPQYYNFREFPFVKKNEILKKYKNYFKFTFVRNPYDRLVSCYEHWIKNEFRSNFDIYDSVKPEMSFEEFVKAISKIPDHISDGHFRSQHTFITDRKGNLLVNFIGKIENINTDFKKVCKKTGMPYKKLSRINKKAEKNYREYYDEETKKLVQERYKKDFEMFGYEF